VRLVDDEHGAQAARVSRFESFAEGEEQFRLVLPLLHVEEARDVLVKFRDGEARVEDVADEHGAVQMVVLPVPTSPVTTIKPLPLSMP
jgi:hypothetical protein